MRFAPLLLLAPLLLGADYGASIEAYNATAKFPLPELTAAHVKKLDKGDVIRVRVRSEDPDEPQSIFGFVVTELPRERVWVGAMDPHFLAAEEVAEHRISPDGHWPTRWYQYLTLPWPFTARHWVIDVMNNHELAAATDGACWEHWWDLVDGGPALGAAAVANGEAPGITVAMADDAIYTPVNRGAWLTITLDDGRTLLGYHVTTVIGGAISDDLVADYSAWQMKKLLKGVVKRGAEEVPGHYDDAHEPLAGGDGRPVAPISADP